MNFAKVKLPSNRKFGYSLSVIFLLLSIYFFFAGTHSMFYCFGLLAIIFFFLTYIKASILLPLNKLWMRFGLLLGVIVTPIVLGVIFFAIFTPIAILMRLMKRDELKLRLTKKKSYWIKRESQKIIGTFENQF